MPNGFYQLVLAQELTDGTSARRERDVFIAPQGSTAAIQLKAQPNLVQSGGKILLSAQFGAVPADGRSVVKIFTVGGELVRALKLAQGQVAWDLTGAGGQEVASGIYLVVLDGVDVATGAPARKTIKVVVLR